MRQQADYLLANCTTGFVNEPRLREQIIYNTSINFEEAHSVDNYARSDLNVIQRSDQKLTINGKGYLYALDGNPSMNVTSTPVSEDICMRHLSPQTTSSSVVSTNINSDYCKGSSSANRSSSQKNPTKNISVSTVINKKANKNMGKKIQVSDGRSAVAVNSLMRSDNKTGHISDPKILRRLAQNREAARKSRLRKKAYVQQLESSRVKLSQIEQDLGRISQQGTFPGLCGHAYNGLYGLIDTGVATFNLEYAQWLDENQRQMGDLRVALQANLSDQHLQILLENFMSHFYKIFQLKSIAVKADVFHLLSGMYKTPAERCFMWIGGFRPSEILKILSPQIEPLSEQQFLGVYNLQLSSQQAEDALTQGMESLQQTLAETVACSSLSSPDCNIDTYMSQMALAMGKLGTLESFVRQADNLRQRTLQQMQKLLTVQQMVKGVLAMGDYFNCLRALSSLWSARPKD